MRNSLLLVFLLLSVALPAQSPTMDALYPMGGERGKEIEVTFYGRRIDDAEDLFFYRQGLHVLGVEKIPKNTRSVKMRLRIDADCPLGAHPLRIRTKRGITNMKLFWVGVLPELHEKGANDTREQAREIPLNVTINGTIRSEDRDWYAVDVPAGSRAHFEVQGIRLGHIEFDPYLTIYDEAGKEVDSCDNCAFGRMDPLCSVETEKAARFYIELREAAHGGSRGSIYRLHVGTFPRPTAALPSGGKPGETIELTLLGDGPPRHATVTLPHVDEPFFDYFPETEHGISPTPIRLRLAHATNVLEPEKREPKKHPVVEIPSAIGGVLAKPGEIDRYRFRAKKGERLVVRALSRSLRSPVDPVVFVTRGDSRSANDDSGGTLDSVVNFRAKEDGTYTVSIYDHLRRGGPEFVYRLEVTRPDGRISTRTSLRRDAEWVAVPRGGRMMTILTATNKVDGAKPILMGLPAGVSALTTEFRAGASTVPVVLEAAGWASITGRQANVGLLHPGRSDVRSARLHDFVRLIRVRNDQTYSGRYAHSLPVAVTDPAPFAVEVEPPTVPIVRGSPLRLRVKLTRAKGFDDAVRVRLAWLPPGISAGEVTVPKGKDTATIPLSASGSARPGSWHVAGYGLINRRGGTLRVGTNLAPLEVATQWVTAKIGKARTELGANAELAIDLTKGKAFAGDAKAELLNLPRGVTAKPATLRADTKRIEMPLAIDKKAATGKHRPLLRVTVPSKSGPIVHYFRGGELRVHKPLPKRKAAKAKPNAKPTPPKPDRGSVAKPKT